MIRLEGARVLVTGITGFVGPHLAGVLSAAGAQVHALGNDQPPPGLVLASWTAADLRDAASLAAAFRAVSPHAVVHLAGQSSAARSFADPVATFEINALGTWRLLEAVREAAPHARVLVIGSGEAYGPQPAGSRVTEDAAFCPVSPYALSKAAADAFAVLAGERLGLDVVRVRAFAHAGPGQRPPFVLPSWAEQIVAIEAGRAEPVLRVGNLEVVRDLTDVRDVVRAYALLLERGRRGAAYNVCLGSGVGLDEVVRKMASRALRPVRVEVDPERLRPSDVPYLVGDPAAIARDTGWRAEIGLDRTLDDLLAFQRAEPNPRRPGE